MRTSEETCYKLFRNDYVFNLLAVEPDIKHSLIVSGSYCHQLGCHKHSVDRLWSVWSYTRGDKWTTYAAVDSSWKSL